ncbi:hypothetical protein DES53_10864 [Roseimicrobium gellanilyticum]|uniref:PH (Pleckstrin Homology) domain-containing protein n=1 Tax=Roseimicrobium gellanilyticum TaxID=748857 RepID=A0A366HDA2_9BACT|nr:hypothetical protein [Roseimicrobium gellanilyticum]RBP40357.1 hypothetical protein DES53_10864 [Roseimicrobium gellanilyticum]
MTYTFPTWVPLLAIAVAVIAAVVGFIFYRLRLPTRLVLIASAIALIAGGIFAPMLAMDKVILDDEKLEQTTGFWFSPTVKGFRLAEVEQVTIGTKRDRKNRVVEVWFVQKKDGSAAEIDPGDLRENNGPDIVKRLREKGIRIR